jgi:sugar phosphate isomerase/epimerase
VRSLSPRGVVAGAPRGASPFVRPRSSNRPPPGPPGAKRTPGGKDAISPREDEMNKAEEEAMTKPDTTARPSPASAAFTATQVISATKGEHFGSIEQAHAIGAPLIVLVCGAVPGQSLVESRKQIADGISACLPAAEQAGVKLSIEPLHPMYADDRSAVNTMRQAHEICDALGSPKSVGIAVDVYHVWWDPELKSQIDLAGQTDRLHAFHICDWKTPTSDLLNDRGLMGEGCINIREISGWVDATGFTGHREVEIFSNRWWSGNQGEFLDQIASSYSRLYA